MKPRTLLCLVLALVLAGSAISACSPAATAPSPTQPLSPPTQPPAPPPPDTSAVKDRCGDGVCDEAEQKKPGLCPQDCPTPTPQAQAAVTPAPPPPTATPLPSTPTAIPDTPTPKPEVTEAAPPTPAPAGAAQEATILASGEVARLGDPATISQEGGAGGAARQANVAFILDGSGSMNAELPGTGKAKLAIAKEVMAELVPQVPPEVNGALWIYGHRYPQDPKEQSCQDIEKVFDMGLVDAAAYTQKINAVTALGYTPIADSMEQAARDLPAGDLNSIILVSDGEETCGGDPCALAEALKASDAGVTIHVVGYTVEEVAREQLQCIARVSGGTYHDAEDAAGLLRALEEAMAATVAETILRVELMGPDGTEESGNVLLYEAGSDRMVSGYIAWKDNAVPPGGYDLLVDTLPWTLYQGLAIGEGSTTIVRIRLGAIRALTPDGEETTVEFYDAATGGRLGYYGGTVLLVPGSYHVSINQSASAPITVNAGETKDVLLGAIQVEGDFEIYDAASKRLGYYSDTILLIPGTYKVVVSGGPIFEDVVVKAGEVTVVK
jgi:Mg-chelatase subunit ChlD